MTIAVIFAGGSGQRMNTRSVPKQFLELHGKPILVYTLEQFQRHEMIDAVVVVMLEGWIEQTWKLIKRYQIDKVAAVVPGGENGQASIYRGLCKASEIAPKESIVLIHDGVRPLIDEKTITHAIQRTREKGSAITVSSSFETVAMGCEQGKIGQIVDRTQCKIAKAPQCFILGDIVAAHRQAMAENRKGFIDSASLMQYYGKELFTVEGSPENIKITTPADFYIFRAIVDARENSQIFGI